MNTTHYINTALLLFITIAVTIQTYLAYSSRRFLRKTLKMAIERPIKSMEVTEEAIKGLSVIASAAIATHDMQAIRDGRKEKTIETETVMVARIEAQRRLEAERRGVKLGDDPVIAMKEEEAARLGNTIEYNGAPRP